MRLLKSEQIIERMLTKFKIWTILDLSRHLGVDVSSLKAIIAELEKDETKLYRSREVPKKSGGKRIIDAPFPRLKNIQRLINKNILQRVKIHEAAFGAVKGKKLRDFLNAHCGKQKILIFDLKDFFSNIKQNQVYKMFCDLGLGPEVAKGLTCLTAFKGRLPQGPPSSPMIANIIAGLGNSCLDKRLEGLCKQHTADHGRWVDDIPISGPGFLPKLKRTIEKIIIQSGFKPKAEKTKIYAKNEAQIITGHLVNSKPNIQKFKKKQIRAELDRCKHDRILFMKKKLILRGQIAHFQSINPSLGEKLLSEFNSISVS